MRHLFAVAIATAALVSTPGVVRATNVVNGSFESASFAGWVTQDLAIPFFPLQVGGAGISSSFGFFVSAPTDGAFAALHGFDGSGPGTIRIGQDVTVTGDGTLIEFDYRAAWDLVNFCFGCQDRIFDVNVEVAGGGANLASFNVLTATAGTLELDTGDLTGVVDLGAFVGQTIRLSFDFFVPQNFTGPAFFQLDHVRVARDPWIANGAVRTENPGAVRWSQIVGIVEAGNLVGTGGGQLRGGGQPWSARSGNAQLNVRNEKLSFEVKGLVLAGGNGIGTPGPVLNVKGTLVCDTDGSATGDSVLVDTPAVELSVAGDASFSGSVAPLPSECFDEADIAFVIRPSASP